MIITIVVVFTLALVLIGWNMLKGGKTYNAQSGACVSNIASRHCKLRRLKKLDTMSITRQLWFYIVRKGSWG